MATAQILNAVALRLLFNTKTMSHACDICDSEKNVIAGRWIFYCPKHKQNDIDKTFENEIAPDIENGNFSYLENDGELAEIFLKNA